MLYNKKNLRMRKWGDKMMCNDFIIWLQAQSEDKQFLITIGLIIILAISLLLSYLWDKYKEKEVNRKDVVKKKEMLKNGAKKK